MSNALEVMRKENNNQEKQLSKENNIILTDIVVYLRSSNLSEYSIETIRKELFGMALESQLRNAKFSDTVGEDHKTFCDELIKSGAYKTSYEKHLENLYIFFNGVGFLFLVEVFFSSTITNIFTKGNFVMPIKLGFVISTACSVIFAYAIYWYITKKSFELSSKNKPIYKIIFISTFALVWTLGIFLGRVFDTITLFYINCLLPLMFFIIGIITVKLLENNYINKNIKKIN